MPALLKGISIWRIWEARSGSSAEWGILPDRRKDSTDGSADQDPVARNRVAEGERGPSRNAEARVQQLNSFDIFVNVSLPSFYLPLPGHSLLLVLLCFQEIF